MARTVTENKFPLGWWKPGETRKYNDWGSTEITIQHIDFTLMDQLPSKNLNYFWSGWKRCETMAWLDCVVSRKGTAFWKES